MSKLLEKFCLENNISDAQLFEHLLKRINWPYDVFGTKMSVDNNIYQIVIPTADGGLLANFNKDQSFKDFDLLLGKENYEALQRIKAYRAN